MHAVPARSQCASGQRCRTAQQISMLTVAAWVPPVCLHWPQLCHRHLRWCLCRLVYCRTPWETRDLLGASNMPPLASIVPQAPGLLPVQAAALPHPLHNPM